MAKSKTPDSVQAGASKAQKIHNIILGTAGHIDHGKTALIERLTGINADRLPEEKDRGMTIDLGFARYEIEGGRRVGIIDVPGHERFIKNMVAGASGIDIVLLVVAADDGVMPQTREHLEIMSLLGIEHGIVVVTKKDIVSEDLLELAVEDVRETVEGTFLETARVVTVSSISGEGIEELRGILNSMIEDVPRRKTEGLFRMPIQRVFSSKGFGTVLTGVPVSGSAIPGDTLEVLPLGKSGRVRSIQAYMSAAEKAQAGQSSAVNVSDIDYKKVHRGMVLTTPEFFRSSSMLEAKLSCLASNTRALRHLSRVRFHCGTAEVLGTLYLLEARAVEPGQTMFVQLRLEEPVVTVPGDRFVLRLHSPMITVGGGEIIDQSRWRLKQGKDFVIESLKDKEIALDSPQKRLLILINDRGFDAFPEDQVARESGLSLEESHVLLQNLLDQGQLFNSSRQGLFISRQRFDEALIQAHNSAKDFFHKNPRRLLMQKISLRNDLKSHDVFFQDLLATLEKDKKLRVVRGEHLQWAFHTPKLSQAESKFRKSFLAALEATPFTPPGANEIAAEENLTPAQVESIVSLLVEEGLTVKIANGIFFHAGAINDAKERLRSHLKKAGSMTASEAKNVLQSSRKYMIPLLEYFDQEGLTVRRGDVRELREPS